MTKTLGFGFAALALLIGCGDGSSGEGGGGAGGSDDGTTGSTKAATGSTVATSSTSASSTSTTTGATTGSTTAASTTGAGGGADHCANAVRCDGVQGYFCYEISGPDAAFEQACAEELFGTYAEGPCGPEYDTTACLFDCVEQPSVFSVAITIDQGECEGDGGTWVENP